MALAKGMFFKQLDMTCVQSLCVLHTGQIKQMKTLYFLFITSYSVFCMSEDWTEFRGPMGNGHSEATNLPREWSEDQHIQWKASVEGLGWSSPVVRNDRIFLTTAIPAADGNGHSLNVVCLKAADGSEEWNTTVIQQMPDGVEMHKKNSHASPTPVVDGELIYVHFGPNGTACLNTRGEILWKNTTLSYQSQHGTGGCPALYKDTLVICCDGKDHRFVAGLNKVDGKVKWKTDRELEPSRGFSFSTPTIIESANRVQAVCPGSGGVWSYDVLTGEQIWRVAYGEGYSVVPRPIVAHGLVYVCSGFGDGQLIAIDPGGEGDVTETHVKWRSKKGVPKSPSVIIVGDELYMVDDRGIASCLDAITGDLHWQHRLKGGFSASPSYADGVIYFQNETGQTTVIKPGTSFDEVATNNLGDGKLRTFASFGFVGSSILLRNETHLYRITR